MNFTGFTEFDMNEELYRAFNPSSETSSVATEFPVYRSVQISAPLFHPHSGFDSVVNMPHLSKPTLSKPLLAVSTSNEFSQSSEFEDFEFFLSSPVPPCIEDLGFCPLASTHMELTMGVGDIVQTVNEYLAKRDISAKFLSNKFRWVCDMEQDFEAVKFEIQIYTTLSGVTIEFNRMRGCSMVYSKIFRECKCTFLESPKAEAARFSPRDITCLPEHNVTSNACPVVEWIKNDPVEGVKVLCEMIRDKCIVMKRDGALVRDACAALIAGHPSMTILPILSLTKLLVYMHTTEEQIPNIRVLLDILIPSVARNGCASGSSDYVRKQSAVVMESISQL
jgi:hypothetical protein